MPIIVDYDAGNVRSVQRACERVGLDAEISADPDVVRQADRVIFPGVGSAESAVDTLHHRGLDQALTEFAASGKPLLGICLGLQIMLDRTEEGDKPCLGLIPGVCHLFRPSDTTDKVPQIGWNSVSLKAEHPMLKNSVNEDEFYFVHSYYAAPVDPQNVIGTTHYGGVEFASIIARDNLFATQFHLEKSGELGLRLLSSFRDWTV